MAESAPLLSEEETARPHGHGAVFVIALPDHHADDARQACPERQGWGLRLAAGALLVLAAFAVAGHYHYCCGVHHSSPGVLGERSDGRASSSFLLPLHPKEAKASPSRPVLAERQYYTSISIGDFAMPYFLDVDTGTDLTWIRCGDAPHANRTKGPHPLYKPAEQNMVHPRDSLCRELQGNQNCCDTCERCEYEVAYADRSSSAGVLARDVTQLVNSEDATEDLEFVFGCAHDQQGTPLDSTSSTDGVLGLSNGAISLPAQLAGRGIIANVFGHCIPTDPGSSGYMFLGDGYVPRWGITWVPVRNGPENVYSSQVQEVSYAGRDLNARRQAGKLTQVIFDSGSPYTYFPREIYRNLIASLQDVSPAGFVRDESDQTLPFCMKPDFPVRSVHDVKELFKPLQLEFRKRWFVIPTIFSISPEDYLIISDKGNVCLGLLDGTEAGHYTTIIIGGASLRGKLVVYDNDEGQIGWAQSDCTSRPQRESRVPSFLSRALRSPLL